VLVLSRKLNESLVIGENIVVTILSIDREQVKLGIEAPREIPVIRHELFIAVKEQSIIEDQLSREPAASSLEKLREVMVQLAAADEANGQIENADQVGREKPQE
jgi:carbon storage regulator